MNQLIKMDEEYRKWIEDIGKRINRDRLRHLFLLIRK